jgi:hypothetical protein
MILETLVIATTKKYFKYTFHTVKSYTYLQIEP